MLSEKTFNEAIDFIKSSREREKVFVEALNSLSPDTHNDTFIYSSYEAELVDVLCDAMKDDELIPFFIYDTNFGTDKENNWIIVDNKKIDLSDSKKLYEYLKNS